MTGAQDPQLNEQGQGEHPQKDGINPVLEKNSRAKTLSIVLDNLKLFYPTCSAFAWVIPAILWGCGFFFICQAMLTYQPALPLSQYKGETGLVTAVPGSGVDNPTSQQGRIELNSVKYWLRIGLLLVLMVVWGLLAGWLYLFLHRRDKTKI